MARRRRKPAVKEAKDYRHEGETRKNIPPAKIAGEGQVPEVGRVEYSYSPHLPPHLRFDRTEKADRLMELVMAAAARALDEDEIKELVAGIAVHEPWLEWTGKHDQDAKGRFEVDPIALHIHERVSTQAICRVAARDDLQRDLFADPRHPYREAVQFYSHDMRWTNRLILGECAQVMASLGRREGLNGKIQMIYMDPPYGIKFASNFQPEILKRLAHDAKADKDLTREAETVRAYRDTWRLGKHSYLAYLRERLAVAHELLKPSGSIFVQINDESSHLVRLVLDQVFGVSNFVSQISFQTTSGFQTKTIGTLGDYLLWYARDKPQLKVRKVYAQQPPILGKGNARWVFCEDRSYRGVRAAEKRGEVPLPKRALLYKPDNILSQGSASADQYFEHQGRGYRPAANSHWKANYPAGMERLAGANRVHVAKNSIQYRRYATDHPYTERGNMWTDTGTGSFTERKRFVVQTNTKVIERCIHLATDPGDLVLDPTCGSGTTAWCAEKWGRRWITVDTSRVGIAIARQRLLTAVFELFETCEDGDKNSNPGAGLRYKRVPHITLEGIATNEHLDPILERYERILEDHLSAVNREVAAISTADRKEWALPPYDRDRSVSARTKATIELDLVGWYHWEVPFSVPPEWPAGLRSALAEYANAWRAKIDEVDECIANNSGSTKLVDEPAIVRGVPRVSGPFTVEGVRPEELSPGTEGLFDGAPLADMGTASATGGAPSRDDPQNTRAYLARMVDLLRRDGVTFPNNQRRRFIRIESLFESGGGGDGYLHAEALWDGSDEGEPNDVAVAFGPQYGPVTAEYVENLIRASRRYDHLVIAGFSFDAEASAVIQESTHPRLTIHQAYIRPDVNDAMDGVLKETSGDQLFTVFGQPDIAVTKHGDEEWVCELRGVDIYDPVRSVVQSTGSNKVAAWFLDQDFDGRCFCITQAFFPREDAWKKIAKALKSSADPRRFAAFKGTTSLPFAEGRYSRIAVKVIDPRGNEVMAVKSLDSDRSAG